MFSIGELFTKKQQVEVSKKRTTERVKVKRSTQISACKELIVIAQLIRIHGYSRSVYRKIKSIYEDIFEEMDASTFSKRCNDAKELLVWLDSNELEIVKK